MEDGNTNWTQSVTGVLIKEGKVLLARHTYGVGKDKLILPGGYVMHGETPEEAVKREFLEEVGITVAPKQVIGIRFNSQDWYVAFSVGYVGGEARSDHDENSEVVWLPVAEALERADVPDLSKRLITCALHEKNAFAKMEYEGRFPPYSLYGAKS